MQSIVTQTLASIQGEGYGIGKPILLIRLNGCNYSCKFCDSSWTNLPINCVRFSFADDKIQTPFLIDEKNIHLYIEFIQKKFLDKYEIKTVLFTGGEPFLHTEFMSEFIAQTQAMKYFDLYEIETNGSLLFDNFNFIKEHRDSIQLNISPKPTEYAKYYGVGFKNVIDWISSLYEMASLKRSFLKFVYSKAYEQDIVSFIKKFQPEIPIYMSSLTPKNGTKDLINIYRSACLNTLEFCLKTGYRYSPREHVFLFGDNRNEFEAM